MKQLNNEAIKQSIIKTLVYSQMFGWPMTEKEIFRQIQNLKGKNQNGNSKFKINLRQLIKERKIEFKNNFYFLAGKERLVKRRLEREKWAREKFKIAIKAAGYLKIIPTILLVGVSGGLAVGNVDINDDIDFFIVCRTGTLWTTRFFSTLLLDLLARRRRPNDKNIKNKICLNMFVDELGMVVPEKERDLYTAHEVIQMKVLWDKNGIYKRFLKLNDWVDDYLPNFKFKNQNLKLQCKSKKFLILTCHFPFCILNFTFTLVENFFQGLQLIYMEKKRTSEKIESHRLMFHPKDKRLRVLNKYRKLVKALKL
jgi:hypothetical protein